ncbi:Adhesion G-protein coupled receptor G2 [Trichoplax sp. H2]|nr:Adhesion G-protein coupled receptor G2 [Trichoplax sp. H2]|eukprot:RDD44197.1 Adhesion G-protein coupled receptor G2 [Trichoplax sp. H2]
MQFERSSTVCSISRTFYFIAICLGTITFASYNPLVFMCTNELQVPLPSASTYFIPHDKYYPQSDYYNNHLFYNLKPFLQNQSLDGKALAAMIHYKIKSDCGFQCQSSIPVQQSYGIALKNATANTREQLWILQTQFFSGTLSIDQTLKQLAFMASSGTIRPVPKDLIIIYALLVKMSKNGDCSSMSTSSIKNLFSILDYLLKRELKSNWDIIQKLKNIHVMNLIRACNQLAHCWIGRVKKTLTIKFSNLEVNVRKQQAYPDNYTQQRPYNVDYNQESVNIPSEISSTTGQPDKLLFSARYFTLDYLIAAKRNNFGRRLQSDFLSKMEKDIISNVISASFKARSIYPLKSNATITFKHKLLWKANNLQNAYTTQCVYWDYKIKDGWSDTGCTIKSTNHTHTICVCNHLTDFALASVTVSQFTPSLTRVIANQGLIMARIKHPSQKLIASTPTIAYRRPRHVETTPPKINITEPVNLQFTYMSHGIALVCTALTAGTYYVLLRGSWNWCYFALVHLTASSSLACFFIMLAHGLSISSNATGCSAVASLTYFFIMATCTWTSIEINISITTKLGRFKQYKISRYFIYGYGTPLVLTIIIIATLYPNIVLPPFCWISPRNIEYIMIIPVSILSAVSLILLYTYYSAYQKLSLEEREILKKEKFNYFLNPFVIPLIDLTIIKTRTTILVDCFLVILIGCGWLTRAAAFSHPSQQIDVPNDVLMIAYGVIIICWNCLYRRQSSNLYIGAPSEDSNSNDGIHNIEMEVQTDQVGQPSPQTVSYAWSHSHESNAHGFSDVVDKNSEILDNQYHPKSVSSTMSGNQRDAGVNTMIYE